MGRPFPKRFFYWFLCEVCLLCFLVFFVYWLLQLGYFSLLTLSCILVLFPSFIWHGRWNFGKPLKSLCAWFVGRYLYIIVMVFFYWSYDMVVFFPTFSLGFLLLSCKNFSSCLHDLIFLWKCCILSLLCSRKCKNSLFDYPKGSNFIFIEENGWLYKISPSATPFLQCMMDQ
jgi:hypothetical protein